MGKKFKSELVEILSGEAKVVFDIPKQRAGVSELDVEVLDEEVQISLDGPLSEIKFSKKIHSAIDEKLSNLVVILLLDNSRVLCGGPCVIYGSYLTVQPWSQHFSTSVDHPSRIMVSYHKRNVSVSRKDSKADEMKIWTIKGVGLHFLGLASIWEESIDVDSRVPTVVTNHTPIVKSSLPQPSGVVTGFMHVGTSAQGSRATVSPELMQHVQSH
ncbi:hypothetical protein GQ457_02G031800 [Hibiscus cannabinus]